MNEQPTGAEVVSTSTKTLPIAVVVGPGGLGVAQLVSMMKFQPLLVLSQKPSRRKLKRFLGVSTIHARPGDLPLPDACVDLVVIAGGLGAVTPLHVGLSRLARVLKPGGMLVSLTPEPSALHTKLWMVSTSILKSEVGCSRKPASLGTAISAEARSIRQSTPRRPCPQPLGPSSRRCSRIPRSPKRGARGVRLGAP